MADLLLRNARVLRFRSRGDLARAYTTRDPRGRGPGLAEAALRRALDAAHPAAAGDPVDIRIVAGVVTEVAPHLPGRGEPELDVEGGFVIPGLWDAHVHMDLEAARAARLDTAAASCAEDVLGLVASALADTGAGATGAGATAGTPATLQGFGHRLSAWPRIPTVAELDAVTGDVPTVLISGDVHSGWVNSAGLRALGLRGATEEDPGEPLSEDTWFAAMNRLDVIPGTADLRESGYRSLLDTLLARGLTGITDMTQPEGPDDWPRRAARLGATAATGPRTTITDGSAGPARVPRIRAALYRGQLERWLSEGLRTGDALPGSPLLGDGTPAFTQGPLKVISDGSMGTRTALLRDPYPEALGLEHSHGIQNISRAELTDLLTLAAAGGLQAAIHAIGDAAMEDVIAAFEASGAGGRIEHAQLLPTDEDGVVGPLERIVALGLELSVQPAHLVDDWAFVPRIWPGLEGRTYAFADMVGAGALLAMGSDAPVASPDPWLAMAVAVTRWTPDGSVWSPLQRLTPEEALAASVDGCPPVGVGSRGDLVVLEDNPFGPVAPDEDGVVEAGEALAATRPLATVVAGQIAFIR